MKLPCYKRKAKKPSAGEGPLCWKPGQRKMNSAESSRGPVSDSRRPLLKLRGPCSYGWRDLYNLSFLVSSNLPRTGGRQGAQLRDSGEATPQHVPKALSAEPQAGGGSSVLSLLCAKDQTNETVSTGQIFSKSSGGL